MKTSTPSKRRRACNVARHEVGRAIRELEEVSAALVPGSISAGPSGQERWDAGVWLARVARRLEALRHRLMYLDCDPKLGRHRP